MHTPAYAARALRVALIVGLLASTLPVHSIADAATAPRDEASDIILVLDFSGSILEDEAVRTNFADALDGIGARIEQTAATLAAGDATVSIVTFATRAADLPGCTGLQLRENEGAVIDLADCLRRVAATYRNGVDPSLTNAIGDDTNYVAAMERAAVHLPPDSVRPAIIFFTDGRHEAAGVPVTDVVPARDRLFGDRSPFALLPVGMGVNPEDRPRLEAGLAELRMVRDFDRCDGGALEWPAVVFESAEAAGQAVAIAFQDVSCTFTVAPTAAPTASPEPPLAVRNIRLAPGDSVIEVSWAAPTDAQSTAIEGYRVRCRPSTGGDWIESARGVSTETSATVGGLVNGAEYMCEVSAVRPQGTEAWTAAVAAAVPFGRPPPPSKPTARALDTAARLGVTMPADGPVTGVEFECSADGGSTWTVERRVDGDRTVVEIGGLTNGTDYVCRAFATNDSGVSDASPLSDAFRPCSGLVDCNPLIVPLLGGLAVLLLAGILLTLWRWYAGRRVYVTAQVDRFAPVTLGRGPKVGMAFVTRPPYKVVTGVTPAEGRAADIRIRYAGGEMFEVTGSGARRKVAFGHLVEVADPTGQPHDLVLNAYDERPEPLQRPDDEGPQETRARRR
jgi:hypothetical protein